VGFKIRILLYYNLHSLPFSKSGSKYRSSNAVQIASLLYERRYQDLASATRTLFSYQAHLFHLRNMFGLCQSKPALLQAYQRPAHDRGP
jgi:hypothetical protein